MTLHYYQKQILRKLMYSNGITFSELQIDNISSKHFNYHLKVLLDKGLVQKSQKIYVLTNKGKKLVGGMTDDASKTEEQPKVTVWLYIRRKKGKSYEYLATRRLKQPYYGKVGWVCGKSKFGETFEETARRELFEETNLTADFKLSHIYHKIRYDESNHVVQDSLFIVMIAENPCGKLESSNEGELFWTSKSAIVRDPNRYDDVVTDFKVLERGKLQIIENVQAVEKEF